MSAPLLGGPWRRILEALPENWDQDGAPRITQEALGTLARFAVVPCSHGGIQLEVHRDGYDIEIDIWPSGRIASALICVEPDLEKGAQQDGPNDSEVSQTKGEFMSNPTFNPAELSRWKDAKHLAVQINNFKQRTGVAMAGGVQGIYVPPWEGGPHGDPEPGDPSQGLYWLHFKMNNGLTGVNVGLILDKIKRYNGATTTVFYQLNNEWQSSH